MAFSPLSAAAALAAGSACGSDSGTSSVARPIDIGGIRASLADAGYVVGGFYLGETFINVGGTRQGTTYDGALWAYLLGDLHKAGLWRGLCLYADVYQLHGQSITTENVQSLASISAYEAIPSTRLSELWLEQHMLNGYLTVRVGQLTADTEFLISSGADHFLNSTWGWATLPDLDLPGAGPSYPLATPGLRIAVNPDDNWILKLGMYNGDPAGKHCAGNPQTCDDNGFDFRFDSPPLLIAEASYKYNQSGILPGTVKAGGWNQFGRFYDQPFDLNPPTFAPTIHSVRIDRQWAIYGIIDQLIWRALASSEPKGVGVFGRAIASPTGQSLLDFYVDGGITFSGMIPWRSNDVIALGLAYSSVTNLHGSDLLSSAIQTRAPETLFEVCYTAELRSNWTLQPDFQYIWQPGGVSTAPSAAVWGLRLTTEF